MLYVSPACCQDSKNSQTYSDYRPSNAGITTTSSIMTATSTPPPISAAPELLGANISASPPTRLGPLRYNTTNGAWYNVNLEEPSVLVAVESRNCPYNEYRSAPEAGLATLSGGSSSSPQAIATREASPTSVQGIDDIKSDTDSDSGRFGVTTQSSPLSSRLYKKASCWDDGSWDPDSCAQSWCRGASLQGQESLAMTRSVSSASVEETSNHHSCHNLACCRTGTEPAYTQSYWEGTLTHCRTRRRLHPLSVQELPPSRDLYRYRYISGSQTPTAPQDAQLLHISGGECYPKHAEVSPQKRARLFSDVSNSSDNYAEAFNKRPRLPSLHEMLSGGNGQGEHHAFPLLLPSAKHLQPAQPQMPRTFGDSVVLRHVGHPSSETPRPASESRKKVAVTSPDSSSCIEIKEIREFCVNTRLGQYDFSALYEYYKQIEQRVQGQVKKHVLFDGANTKRYHRIQIIGQRLDFLMRTNNYDLKATIDQFLAEKGDVPLSQYTHILVRINKASRRRASMQRGSAM